MAENIKFHADFWEWPEYFRQAFLSTERWVSPLSQLETEVPFHQCWWAANWVSRTCPTDPRNELYFLVSMKVAEEQNKRVPAPLTWPWVLIQKENPEGGDQCPQIGEMRGWDRDGGAFCVPALLCSACLVRTVNTCGCSQLLSVSVLGKKSREMGNVLTLATGLPPTQQQQGWPFTAGPARRLCRSVGDLRDNWRTARSNWHQQSTENLCPRFCNRVLGAENHRGPSAGPSTGPCWTSLCGACTGPSEEALYPPADQQLQHKSVSLTWPWLLVTVSDTTGLAHLRTVTLGKTLFPR